MNELNVKLNPEVTVFLDELNHPFRDVIEMLRACILDADKALTENIKWNGPNYCAENEDRITMRIQPLTTKQIQVIFHRGAKVKEQPIEKLIKTDYKWLVWKENDRAIASFKNIQDIEERNVDLSKIVKAWIDVTR